MKDLVIKYAIMYPHLFPWNKQLAKHGLEISNDEVERIIAEEDLNDLYKRRILGWQIDRLIYMCAHNSNTQLEIENKMSQAFSKLNFKLKELPKDIVSSMISRKDLNTEEKIALFNKFIRGEASKMEMSKNLAFTQTWLVDLFSCYFSLNIDFKIKEKRDLYNKVVEVIQSMIYSDSFKIKRIEDLFSKIGFFNLNIVKDYKNYMKDYFEDFKGLVKNTIDEASNNQPNRINEEMDVEAALLGMIDEVDFLNIKDKTKKYEVEKKQECSKYIEKNDRKLEIRDIEENIKEEDTIIKKISKKIKAISDDLGYKMISVDEYRALKNRNLYLSRNDEELKHMEENSILNLLKKLSAPSEGAVLSELYSTYRNLENTNISNIKAALGDFFNYLMVIGIETNEDIYKIGEVVEVDRSELLKAYQLLRPSDGEEKIKGVVKYPGWRFKNKQFAPPVIQNKKIIEGEDL